MGTVHMHQTEAVAYLTLSHPERLNALSVQMWRQLRAHIRTLSTAAQADQLRALVIRGAEGNFAAGADIAEFQQQRHTQTQVIRYHEKILAPALQAIINFPAPVIAAIEGACVGGGLEIAACCDLRLAAEDARFGVPIHQLGFPMAPQELNGLLRIAGPAVAAELLFEGRILNATEAYHKGLITRVVPSAAFEQEVQNSIAHVLRGAPGAARATKNLIRRLQPSSAPLSSTELEQFYGYAESAEHREGVRAFLEKRTPQFGEEIEPSQ
ncbi:MAG TPA: enoyl-CoA hydratase-related protein [Paenalcaligenes sp.]|nr:enoyl-CoA hydratase-related protein [Paenalcaligenes sp.]